MEFEYTIKSDINITKENVMLIIEKKDLGTGTTEVLADCILDLSLKSARKSLVKAGWIMPDKYLKSLKKDKKKVKVMSKDKTKDKKTKTKKKKK